MAEDEGEFVGGEEEFAEELGGGAEIVDDPEEKKPLAALLTHHPECILDYAETIAAKLPLIASPPLDKDPNHRSVPFLTQYERTKIIGLRANQLSQGARPYIIVPEHVTSVSEIARMELAERRLPFIIRRPMPDGSHEYWRLSDLLILST
jgi:DNA-directed RNA polymerase I, II, and III subunit RPABC2